MAVKTKEVKLAAGKVSPSPILLATMVMVPKEEKKTCWAYVRAASEQEHPQVIVGRPETMYFLKSMLTGATGKWLRVTVEVLP